MLTETTTETWCEVTELTVDLQRTLVGGTGGREVGDRYRPEPACMLGDRQIEIRETTFTSGTVWAATALGVVLLAAAVLAIVIGGISVLRRGREGGGRRKKKPGLIDERFTNPR